MSKLTAGQAKLFEEASEESSQAGQTSKDDECDFCAIARNEVTRHIVFQDDVSVAFLDRRPVFLGHCLLIPNKHYETLSDLPKELVGPLFSNAQLLVRAVQAGLSADGSFVAINNRVSQSVHHLHVHVVPRRFRDGLKGFFWPRLGYKSEEQMVEIGNKIRDAIGKVQSSTQ